MIRWKEIRFTFTNFTGKQKNTFMTYAITFVHIYESLRVRNLIFSVMVVFWDIKCLLQVGINVFNLAVGELNF